MNKKWMLTLILSLALLFIPTAQAAPFTYIAYSFVHGINDAPINSAEHFELVASDAFSLPTINSFSTIKGDLRITADNGLVMCHDAGFTLNGEGRVTTFDAHNMKAIHDLTLEECLALEYENQYNGTYVHVCDFETYISICARHNKTAFITIRNEYIPELLDVMMPIISSHNMLDKCIINSFTLESLELVRERDESISLSWVIENGRFTKATVDTAVNLGNCILSLFNFPEERFGGFRALDSYKKVIAYAQRKGVTLYAAIIDDATIVERLEKYGISGAQMRLRDGRLIQ